MDSLAVSDNWFRFLRITSGIGGAGFLGRAGGIHKVDRDDVLVANRSPKLPSV